MGEIIYAHITYKDQPNSRYTIRISDVKCKKNSQTYISPESETDFDKRKVYYAKWTDCGSACQLDHVHFGYYPAYIHYLGESVQHISEQIKEGGRLIIPSGLQSSESEENVKPKRSQKQNNLLQAVQKKKNVETLNKLQSKDFLSSRKPLIHDSGDEDENTKPDETNRNMNEVGPGDTPQTESEIERQGRTRVRRDLFGKTDEPLHPAESVDQVNNVPQSKDCNRSQKKPAVTKIQYINYNLRKLKKHNLDDESGKKYSPIQNAIDIAVEDLIAAGPSLSSSAQNLPVAVNRNEKRKNPENQNLASHLEPQEDNDHDRINEDEDEGRGEKQHLPPREKRRKRQIEGGLRKKSHREIYEALEYFKNPEPDPDQKNMYEIADDEVYLWEGIAVPACVWFMIKQSNPQIFFNSMIEILWPPDTLVNRCQNLKKVSTRLVGRSPMKELTPRKKRLSYKLYADYLDEKKIKGTEKLARLMKVPYLYTTKINNLRSEYYK